MKRFFATTAMRVFCAWIGAVTAVVLALLLTGTESCSGRSDPDPRIVPVHESSSGGSSSGYSGGHSSWSSGGGGSSFGK